MSFCCQNSGLKIATDSGPNWLILLYNITSNKWLPHNITTEYFHLSVKLSLHFLWFCIIYCTTLSKQFKKTWPTFSTNQKYNQNQLWIAHMSSPVLHVILLRVLIGQSISLHPLWLARVITLVLVFGTQ